MKKIPAAFIFTVMTALCFSQNQLKFNEIWGYVLTGQEKDFSAEMPVTDLCYFSAEINEYGEIAAIPDRSILPAEYKGRVHLVAICESRSLSHFVIDPKYGVSKKIISTLAKAAKDYDGLQIDFELVPKKDSDNFKKFLKTLKKRIGKEKILSVCVHARTTPNPEDVYDYESIAPYADRIFIMAYDQHWATSEPGPVSGMDWSKKVADHALDSIPNEKIIMGLPFYGRTWADPNYSKAWYNSGINRILKENNSPEIKRTDDIPHFEFTAEVTVKGWFDDKESLVKRCIMLKEKNIDNVGFWRIGQEDSEFWPFISAQ